MGSQDRPALHRDAVQHAAVAVVQIMQPQACGLLKGLGSAAATFSAVTQPAG